MVTVLLFGILAMSAFSATIVLAACMLSARTSCAAPAITAEQEMPDLAQAVERLRVVETTRPCEKVGDGKWATRPA